jgi:hypothetical protein
MTLRHSSFLLTAFLFACAEATPHAECSAGSDCVSGVCNLDGTCQPIDGATSSSSGAGGAGGAGGSGAATSSSSSTGTGGDNACTPNNDGVITREEIPLAAGLHATFRVATNATVDTAGVTQADGSRVWDLSGALPGDHGVLVETLPLTGQWFEPDFAGATYATRLSDTEELLGVFEVNDTALLLRGVVSPSAGVSQTSLDYQPPAETLVFPLQEGDTFASSSLITGTALGVFATYQEDYDSKVDAHGLLKTPFGDFQVLRVSVTLTRTLGLVTTVTRSFIFVTECFGTVANMVSQSNEAGSEWTDAAEVRRLSP